MMHQQHADVFFCLAIAGWCFLAFDIAISILLLCYMSMLFCLSVACLLSSVLKQWN